MSHDLRHQPHYAHGIEPIDYMRSRFTAEEMRGFLRGNALKYLSRYDRKGGVEDLEKCQVYLDWLIDHERDTERRAAEAAMHRQKQVDLESVFGDIDK